jgi:hypothetical protein|tara:strand:+ start:54 stop:245 length:192 start_codon:yes stop_codon:yes gene_type:complete
MSIGAKIVKEEEGLDELINYMFFNNKIFKSMEMAIQLMTVGQKNTLTTELRLVKKAIEREKDK